MKVAVAGLFHLGSVTAACLANAGHEVIAYDPNQEERLRTYKKAKHLSLNPA